MTTPPVPPTDGALQPNWPSNVPNTATFLFNLSFNPIDVTNESRGACAPWITKSNPGAEMKALSVDRLASNSCFQAPRIQKSRSIALGKAAFDSSCNPA